MGVTVAIVDSGVNPVHPHVGSIAGGVCLEPDGRETPVFVDVLGHGTAVAAAIHEKAPLASLYIVKVFDRALVTRIQTLVRAIEWAAERRIQLVNLSLGTAVQAHAEVLRAALAKAEEQGTIVVAARGVAGERWLPGTLAGVIGVELDWSRPRHMCEIATSPDGYPVVRASGYPRDIPGVPPRWNLHGLSFAVANVTGLLAKALHKRRARSAGEALHILNEDERRATPG